MNTFGIRLRELREKAGLTQEQLGDKAGLHKYSVAKLERGEREPAWSTVRALAKALGVDCTAFEQTPEGDGTPRGKRGRPRRKR